MLPFRHGLHLPDRRPDSNTQNKMKSPMHCQSVRLAVESLVPEIDALGLSNRRRRELLRRLPVEMECGLAVGQLVLHLGPVIPHPGLRPRHLTPRLRAAVRRRLLLLPPRLGHAVRPVLGHAHALSNCRLRAPVLLRVPEFPQALLRQNGRGRVVPGPAALRCLWRRRLDPRRRRALDEAFGLLHGFRRGAAGSLCGERASHRRGRGLELA